MSDILLKTATRIAFALYRLAVLVLGAAIIHAQARGLSVVFTPDAGSASKFSGYPIPQSLTIARPPG